MTEAHDASLLERVKAALGVSTLDELSERMGEKRATVGSWSSRGSVPLVALLKVTEIAGCTLDWLVKGHPASGAPVGVRQPAPAANHLEVPDEGAAGYGQQAEEEPPSYARSLPYQQGHRSMKFVLIPRFDVRASAGPGAVNGDLAEQPVGEIAFEAGWMRRHFGRAGTGFALVDVTGDSMEPALSDGETVVVDLHSREVLSGAIYLLLDGSSLLVKRLNRLIGGAVQVLSDNPHYPPQMVGEMGDLVIIGRVVWPRVR